MSSESQDVKGLSLRPTREKLSSSNQPNIKDLVVVSLDASQWDLLWDLYERVFDATEGPHRTDFSGWTRGKWPLPDHTRKALEAGWFRGGFWASDLDANGVPRPGTQLVGAYIVNRDLSDLGEATTSWEPLEPAEYLALHQLTVDPVLRQRGIARKLVAAAIEEARRSGCKALRLTTATINAAANGLYQALGFTRHELVPYDYGDIPIEPWAVPYEYPL